MRPTIAETLASARAGTLGLAECLEILRGSEGRTSNYNPNIPGHALQHSAQRGASSTGFRPLDDEYAERGGILPTGEFRMKVVAPAKQVTNPDGTFHVVPDTHRAEVTYQSGSFHSQFTDDQQAAAMLRLALLSKGGQFALETIANDPQGTLSLTFGTPAGTQLVERTAHLVAARTEWTPMPNEPSKFKLKSSGAPTQAQLDSTENFVLVTPKTMASVVAVLRAKGLGGSALLHVQTFYPTASSAVPAGGAIIKIPGPPEHLGKFLST
jgi:hypothetical protein